MRRFGSEGRKQCRFSPFISDKGCGWASITDDKVGRRDDKGRTTREDEEKIVPLINLVGTAFELLNKRSIRVLAFVSIIG